MPTSHLVIGRTKGMLQRHGWGVYMAKGYTNGKGIHMEQSGVHTIPGYALRTNPNYTDKVEIYTEVGKQRWIWRGVTYVRKRFRLEETHREYRRGTWETQRRVTHRRGTWETQDARREANIQRVIMPLCIL